LPDRRHRRQPKEQTTSERGYDTTWQKLRLEKLALFPFCEFITDPATMRQCLKPAVEVDHIEPISKRPDLRLEMSNLRSACKHCHSQHSAKERWKKRIG
jgi:5-methylcytosine-specific restriction protein A